MRAAVPTIGSRHDADREVLPQADRPVVAALVATMAAWDAAELEAYRSAVIEELSARRTGRDDGFLAVELAALSEVGALGA